MSSEVTFGRFVLSLPHRQLWHDGSAVALKPKEAELLVLLAERRPSIVSRDEIVDRLWRGVASDAALSQTIYRLRQALGRYDASEFIRTLPDVGFQLHAGTPIETRNPNPDFLHPQFGAYQRASLLYSRRNQDSVLAAIEQLERVVRNAHAPFVAAQVLLARAYANAGIRLFYKRADAYARARALLESVIDADNTNADALATLSLLFLFFSADRVGARDAAERALLVGARSPVVHNAAVWERLSHCDFSAALTQADFAMAATPASAIATSLVGTVLYMSGQYVEARDAFSDALTLTAGESTALYYAACTETILGNAKAALRLLARVTDAHICSRVISLRGYICAKRGDRAAAETACMQLSKLRYPSDVALSIVLLALGDEDAAASALMKALTSREPGLFLSAVDPIYEPLWNKFPELFDRIRTEQKPQCEACGTVLSSVRRQPLHRRALCWNCREK